MLRVIISITLLCLTAMGFAQEPIIGGTLQWGLSTDPPNLDPHVASGSSAANVKMNVYSGLVRYDKDGAIVPDLATDWELSADGLALHLYFT